MEWLVQNWFVVLGIVSFLAMVGFTLVKFLGLPTPQQVKKIKAWLLWSVCEAEKELGSKTGQLKLSMVYDGFIAKFPMTAKFISFNTFSKYVDSALVDMKKILEENKNAEAIILNK